MLLFNKMNLNTGDKIRIIKIFYPIGIDKLGKTSTIEVNEDGIYLLDLKMYINIDCIEKIDDNDADKIYIESSKHIYEPIIKSIKNINL